MKSKYKRVLLKLSGEALAGPEKKNEIDFKTVYNICEIIKECVDNKVQLGIVVGGGNFWRGRSSGNMNRVSADYMGMLATVMNALGIADTLIKMKANVHIMTAISMQPIGEPYLPDKAIKYLDKGRVVIFAGGTGNPYFSTDTAAALRAAEVNADVILKATMVDGVYNKDPKVYEDAKQYESLTYDEILNRKLTVMDSTAASLCKENKIPILVFNLNNPINIFDAIMGKNIGTIVH